MSDLPAVRSPGAPPLPSGPGHDPPGPPGGSDVAPLARLEAALAEDALFVAASSAHDKDTLDALPARRAAAHGAAMRGQPHARMMGQFDAWVVEMARALAPVSPPSWMPMMDVVREKVTLEIGARGLRSLFSSKPSDKDVARVKRYGALCTRALRAVFASDGPLDAEESTTVAAVVASFGLPEPDAGALLGEGPIAPETLDVYGEIDGGVARAIVRGAWLAAAADGIDPREEHVVRVLARKLGIADEDVESARREAVTRVEARSRLGAAAVDAVRFVVSDRPGHGVRLAALVGTLTIPRRWRGEALSSIGQGAPVTLAKRHVALAPSERSAVLGIAWAAALIDDPTVARRALLQARWEKVAADLGEDDDQPRVVVDGWLLETLAAAARTTA